MIRDYENLGLKMLDLNAFNKALKLSWVRKYLNDDDSGKWKLLCDFPLIFNGGAEFFRGNFDRKDVSKYNNVPDPFITEIVQIWNKIHRPPFVIKLMAQLSCKGWEEVNL